ncbi:MAG TPA: ABC transporter ATP-binding protein [Gammaproteobacteria bacterium]|nr:ABC transporter ATP-binding protein [Gammaproteobacteria bacterium]
MTKDRSSTFVKIWYLLNRRERWRAVFVFCMTVIGVVISTLGVGAVVPMVVVVTQEDIAASYPAAQPILDALGNPPRSELVIGVMGALVALYVIKSVFLGFLMWIQTRFSVGVTVRMSQQLFSLYLAQPYTFHLQQNSSRLIRNTFSEVAQFAGALQATTTLCTEVLLILAIGGLLLAFEPLGALSVIAVLGVAGLAYQLGTRGRVRLWGERRRYHDQQRLQHTQQSLGGVKEMKVLGREREFLKLFHKHTKLSAKASQNATILSRLPGIWIEVLAVSGLAMLVIAMVWQGRELVALAPTLALFGAAALKLLPATTKVLGTLQRLKFTQPVVENLYDEFKLEVPELPATETKPSMPTFDRKIVLDHVSFEYPGADRQAVSEISLVIRRGHTVGLIGPSGSGKSTLIDIILGILPPDSGTITVDGSDVRDHLRSWQNQIGYVAQSIFLTDDSLRRNVAFGIPEKEIDEGAVRRAIEAAQLDEFVATLPEGTETVVGERGVRLSGGQRQRIGIARALYHDPSVLVLDEATSALDTGTEREVMRAVNALHTQKTIVIVAHRLSTVESCDWLFKLDAGRLVEQGPPDEILWSSADTGSGLSAVATPPHTA